MADEQNTNEQQGQQNEQQNEQAHTAREIELENRVKELEKSVNDLRAENQRIYRRYTGVDKEEQTPTEKLEQQMRDVRMKMHARAIEKMNLTHYHRRKEDETK